MTSKKNDVLEKLTEFSNQFAEAASKYQKEAADLFQALPYDDRLKVFCAVVELLAKGELDEGKSYRGVLYDVFKFGPESYGAAQGAGFLALHNSIYTFDELQDIIKEFVSEGMDIAKDNLDRQIMDFLIKKKYF